MKDGKGRDWSGPLAGVINPMHVREIRKQVRMEVISLMGRKMSERRSMLKGLIWRSRPHERRNILGN